MSNSTFVNYTNHRLKNWAPEQLYEAKELGEIVDIKFPSVLPEATAQEIRALAKSEVEKIMACNPGIVLCQGEFNLCYEVIGMLKARGIKVVAATSRRQVEEKDGRKGSSFKFVQFREY